ncbi:ECF transporter S component [Bacillus sp. B15-48]|uniref:ECF transporter S component n=1 Tax=Bacillus sp. B15-48 TaxID=1548601 RepID=UPI00193F9D4D|nr:ECF transporter S component [Bacillus sp. B15-48]MBM4763266.1 ECF transporter S component [Bacillus sp. B15-48]
MHKKITTTAVLVALTAIGAAIKVPAIIGSVAFDAFPALLAAGLLGGAAAAVVGGMGHLLSAIIGGMPLGAMHGLIAIEMAVLAFIFYLFYKNGKIWVAAILFILGNTFAAPLPFLFLLGEAFYLALVPSLFVGSVLNTIVALILIPRLAFLLKSELPREKVNG